MNARQHRTQLRQLALLCGVVLLSCTDAHLQPLPSEEFPPLDRYLEIRGEYCTEPSANVTFPLKVLYILDQSASLQFTDPENRRFGALDESLNTVTDQPAGEFAFIGFASWSRQQAFTRNRGDIAMFTDPSGGLGPATDYQGALATAVRMIEQDILESGPSERARTRYIINFISDGIPEPRCNPGCEDDADRCSNGEDDDGDGLIDGADPDCANIDDNVLHPDNLYGVCNTDQEVPDDVYVDYTGICPEYNQPTQIMGRVRELLSLSEIYSVGSITLNTVFLFTEMPDVDISQFGYDRATARALLQSMADAGEGIFRDVNLGVAQTDFLNFDISSISAELTLTRMHAFNTHALRNADGELVPDSDGDGLSDTYESQIGTNPNERDSDGDNYGDLFEDRMRDRGFDPADPLAPAVRCTDDRDGDGDGLTDCEEDFLGTDPNAPDSDGDGVLDWIELLVGTDPTVPDGLADFDFDGNSNLEEVLAGTDPTVPDAEAYRTDRITYRLDDLGVLDVANPINGQIEQRHCYDFAARRIPMVITPIPRNSGLNRVLIYTSEKAAKVAGVPGEVRVACFEGFYNGPQSKIPESGIIDVSRDGITAQRDRLNGAIAALNADCTELTAGANRTGVEALTRNTMPPRIQIGRKLYKQAELFDMMARAVDPGMVPTLPQDPHTLFVAMPSFDQEVDCWRPWELDIVISFLSEVHASCLERAGATP